MMGSAIEPTMALGRIVRQPIVADSTTIVNDAEGSPTRHPAQTGHQLGVAVDAVGQPRRREEEQRSRGWSPGPPRPRCPRRWCPAGRRRRRRPGGWRRNGSWPSACRPRRSSAGCDAARRPGCRCRSGSGPRFWFSTQNRAEHAEGVDQRAGQVQTAAPGDVHDLAAAAEVLPPSRSEGSPACSRRHHSLRLLGRARPPVRVGEQGDGHDHREPEQESPADDGQPAAQQARKLGHLFAGAGDLDGGPALGSDRGGFRLPQEPLWPRPPRFRPGPAHDRGRPARRRPVPAA